MHLDNKNRKKHKSNPNSNKKNASNHPFDAATSAADEADYLEAFGTGFFGGKRKKSASLNSNNNNNNNLTKLSYSSSDTERERKREQQSQRMAKEYRKCVFKPPGQRHLSHPHPKTRAVVPLPLEETLTLSNNPNNLNNNSSYRPSTGCVVPPWAPVVELLYFPSELVSHTHPQPRKHSKKGPFDGAEAKTEPESESDQSDRTFLHMEVLGLTWYNNLNAVERAARHGIVLQLTAVLQVLWPRASVEAYGSSVCELGVFNSDVDLCISQWHITRHNMAHFPSDPSSTISSSSSSSSSSKKSAHRYPPNTRGYRGKQDAAASLKSLGKLLRKHPNTYKQVDVRLRSRVPIINLVHVATGLELDISLNGSGDHLLSTDFIMGNLLHYPIIKPVTPAHRIHTYPSHSPCIH